MTARFIIEALAPEHGRAGFVSGVEPLDRYFREQASHDVRRRVTACYVAVEAATHKIAGFYNLSASSVPLAEVPEQLARRLPRYSAVPVACIGRLAVHQDYRGQKLGAALLWDAIVRALRAEMGVFALVVDAKDDQAAAFYRHHGFIALSSLPKTLVLPLTNTVIGG